MNRRCKANGSHLLLQHNVRNDFINDKLPKRDKIHHLSPLFSMHAICKCLNWNSVGKNTHQNTKWRGKNKQTNENYQSDACDVLLPEL